MTTHTEALVIGGGPVGLFAALSLLEKGVAVEVLDAAGERAVRGYACGLHPESLRSFDRLGLMPAILEVAHRVDRIGIHRGAAKVGLADLSVLEGSHPYVLTLRQSELEELLEEALVRRGQSILRHHPVTQLSLRDSAVHAIARHVHPVGAAPAPAVVSSGDLEYTADYVIGADGYFSVCRHMLGVELVSVLPPKAFVVCEFLADLSGWEHEARLALAADSVSAFWPLGPNLGRWTFQVWRHLDQPPTLETLRELLRERAPWFQPRPEQLCWGAVAPFEHRVARSFGQGRVWLAGDAAHSTSPIGFQSMNRGFVEADSLAALIASGLFGEAHHPGLFDRFQRDQQAEWQRLFGQRPGAPHLAWAGPDLASCLPATGADLDVLTAQLQLAAAQGF